MIDLSRGVPGVDGPEPTTFEEFWPYYVSQHLRSVTRHVHVWSTLGAAAVGVALLALGLWLAVPVVAVVAYGANWASHLSLERNRPASWGRPWWSFQADLRLVARYLSRRADEDDVAAVRRALGLHPEHRCLADVA